MIRLCIIEYSIWRQNTFKIILKNYTILLLILDYTVNFIMDY